MNCPHCGNEIGKDEKYCSFCGKPLNPASAAPPKKSKLLPILLGIGAVAVLAGGLLLWPKLGGSGEASLPPVEAHELSTVAPAETEPPAPTETPEMAPADLSFQDISDLIRDAAKLYCGVFLWQSTVDHNDSIPSGSDQFYDYYRVTEADTLDDLRSLCQQHFTREMTETLLETHQWLEQDGKLYVSQSMGIGGPVTEELAVSFQRTSDTTYAVHLIGSMFLDTASPLTAETDETLEYIDGHWVWNHLFDGVANDQVVIKQA